jgi:hypothetical protein
MEWKDQYNAYRRYLGKQRVEVPENHAKDWIQRTLPYNPNQAMEQFTSVLLPEERLKLAEYLNANDNTPEVHSTESKVESNKDDPTSYNVTYQYTPTYKIDYITKSLDNDYDSITAHLRTAQVKSTASPTTTGSIYFFSAPDYIGKVPAISESHVRIKPGAYLASDITEVFRNSPITYDLKHEKQGSKVEATTVAAKKEIGVIIYSAPPEFGDSVHVTPTDVGFSVSCANKAIPTLNFLYDKDESGEDITKPLHYAIKYINTALDSVEKQKATLDQKQKKTRLPSYVIEREKGIYSLNPALCEPGLSFVHIPYVQEVKNTITFLLCVGGSSLPPDIYEKIEKINQEFAIKDNEVRTNGHSSYKVAHNYLCDIQDVLYADDNHFGVDTSLLLRIDILCQSGEIAKSAHRSLATKAREVADMLEVEIDEEYPTSLSHIVIKILSAIDSWEHAGDKRIAKDFYDSYKRFYEHYLEVEYDNTTSTASVSASIDANQSTDTKSTEGNMEVQDEWRSALVRTAARQFVQGIKSIPNQQGSLAKMANTQGGTAVVSFVLGVIIPQLLPKLGAFLPTKSEEVIKHWSEVISQELREEGIAVLQDEVMSLITGPLLDQIRLITSSQDTSNTAQSTVHELPSATTFTSDEFASKKDLVQK